MKVKETYLVLLGIVVFGIVLFSTPLSFAESFIIGMQIYFLLRFINNIGYTVCFFDFLLFYSVLDTLLMPIVGYHLYDRSYALSKSWGWYMHVPEDIYYAFLIPANLALFLGVHLVTRKLDAPFYKAMIIKLEAHARDKGKIGLVLTIVGFIFSFAGKYITWLGFIAYLLAMLRYVGPIYIYFSNASYRKRALLFSMLFFLVEAVLQGMFGEFVMYFILLLIIVTLKFNLQFFSKLSLFVVGIVLVIILQSVKPTYRSIAWQGKEVEGLTMKKSSQLEIFGTLFLNRFSDFNKLFDRRSFFPIYARLNQGYLISRTMDYVPRVEPFAEGETILRALGGIIVPRFLWPDKPEAGGRENLVRFLGMKKKLNYSMNIGPYGEAYGNFGSVYGVLFIFFYGLLIAYLFRYVIISSIQRPTLILWTPVLFFFTLTVETDILSTINSIVKTGIFMLVLFWFVKRFYKVSL